MKKLLSAIFAGIVSVAAAGDFAASFEPGLKGWDVKNMSGAVDIRAGVYKGEKALIVSGLPEKTPPAACPQSKFRAGDAC